MPVSLPLRIETYEVLESTQDTLRARLEAGEEIHGLVVQALEQRAGRGQRARDWRSTRGGSYQTLAVRDTDPPTLAQSYAALAVAVGLARVFPKYGVRVGIKWPNDLYYRGKKLGGILTERLHGHLLIGVGVNVSNEIPETATALRGWDVDGVSMMVLEGIQNALTILADGEAIAPAFAPYDLLEGQSVVTDGGRKGVARGLDAQGCLRLAGEDGKVSSLCVGKLLEFSLKDTATSI